ncbi:MAG TPA: hypothetical protein VFB78_02040 [Acidimicrobiales bacterium]|nr:hypothetical protein [Acidimicrobiales bacterium]
MQYVVLVVGLEFPAIVALVDCINRYPGDFEGGAADRSAWLRWLLISLLLCPILVGYGILLGYYWTVVKRTSPVMHRGHRD